MFGPVSLDKVFDMGGGAFQPSSGATAGANPYGTFSGGGGSINFADKSAGGLIATLAPWLVMGALAVWLLKGK